MGGNESKDNKITSTKTYETVKSELNFCYDTCQLLVHSEVQIFDNSTGKHSPKKIKAYLTSKSP